MAARKFLVPIDLNQLELQNARLQQLATDPGTPVEGQIWYDTVNHVFKYRGNGSTISVGSGGDAATLQSQNGAYYLSRANHTGTQLAATISDFNTAVRTNRLDQMSAPTAAVAMGAQKLTGLAAGTTAGDSLRFEQVFAGTPAFPTGSTIASSPTAGDSSSQIADTQFVTNALSAAINGVDVKASVVAATTAALAITGRTATTLTLGGTTLTVDGIAMANGYRLLVKNSTTGTGAGPQDNGIYTVGGVGTSVVLTRSTDADSAAEVTSGMFTFVEQGTANADSGWILTTDSAVVIGTTSLAFAQFSGAGQITAGTGLTKTGNTLAIDAAYVGQASITTLGTVTTGVWNGTTIAVANGGTGATSASAARANLSATGKYAQTITGGSTSEVVTHALGTRDVTVQVYDATTFAQVECDITMTTTNTITLAFAVAPAAGAYRVVVIG